MPSSTYRVLFRAATVRREAVAGLVAQVTQGAVGVGLILVIREHGGSLALAGAVVGSLSLAAGIARPVQGRLIDSRGAASLMATCGVVHPAAITGIVMLSNVQAPGAAMLALGIVAGAALPPVSTSMRVAWGSAFHAEERTAAYSLVYLTQELAVLAGPLALSALLAVGTASLAVIVVAAVAGAGTLTFAALIGRRQGQPSPRGARTPGRVLRRPGMRVLVAVAVTLGAVIGALEVAAPTVATAHGAPAASGLLIAALSVGGIIGAIVYAGRRWSTAPSWRLVLLQAALTLATAAMIPAASLVLIGVLMLMGGLALNPSLTTLSVLVDEHVPRASAAEAFGWLSLGFATGTGAANAVTGALTSPSQPGAAFVIAAIIAATGTVVAMATRRAPAASGSQVSNQRIGGSGPDGGSVATYEL